MIVANDECEIEPTLTVVEEPSSDRPSVYAQVRSFLIKVAIRAAQNCAAYCLEEWIAPTRTLGPNKTRSPAPGDISSTPYGRHLRPERIDEGCDEPGSVLLAGSSK